MSNTKTTESTAKHAKEVEHKLNNWSNDQIFSLISLAAYYKAESRGYEPGHEIQDWLEAEAEVIHHSI